MTRPDDFELLEPWENFLDDSHRKAFEQQLSKELGRSHPLYGDVKRVLVHRGDCDDVLVELNGRAGSHAVVHLSWSSGRSDSPDFPRFQAFPTENAWRQQMARDHEDWAI